jgi:AraC-like DNA-binding protein
MTYSLLAHPEPVAGTAHARTAAPIDLEARWRHPGASAGIADEEAGRVAVSRWTHAGGEPLTVSHEGSDAHHCIGMNLKCTTLTFSHAGKRLVQGRLTPGAVQVTAPGVRVAASFEAAADVLHLFVSQRVLAECYEDLFARVHAGDVVLGDPRFIRDPALERLSGALAVSQTSDAAPGKVFTDSVSLAIVSRLVACHFTAPPRGTREPAALPQWRMNRVVEYVDAHLSENIGLADIAGSAGLTRMHFAAQFRRATGMRPHDYLLRRRIERAQLLLAGSGQSVLDVALACGFRSQAHFTTVFKRFVGQTPHSWRMKAGLPRAGAHLSH